jgi:UDP-N-acetylmuramoyl-tripeptide--D-alanyl-D-alanine ligase
VGTDSRTIKPGELFVALRGENFEGHDFIEAGAKAGATGALVDLNWAGNVPNNFALLRATDTLQAYQTLAGNYRRSLGLKVLAITGSNGKTSTKDFAPVSHEDFGQDRRHFNNHVGSRTILEATSEDEAAAGEIDDHPGEIAVLSKIAAPDAAIITNIGVAHIEFMGAREAIAAEKGALAEAIEPQGTVILNADDPFTEEIAARTRAKVVLAGTTGGAVRAIEIRQSAEGSEFTIVEGAHRCRALSVAAHMVQNALLAVAGGGHLTIHRGTCRWLPQRRSQKRAYKQGNRWRAISTTATTPTRTR